MKKLGIIAIAFAMLLGMSQCKKENTSASNDEVVKVPITLNVSGNSGSRVAVTPETGVVTFENGDVIHVVSNGVYVGTMTYNGTVFSGEIMEPTEGQKLQFYFLGNKAPEFNADNTECSVVISDQTEYLPVISYAPSRENYQVGKADYNATLLNKCALVKFDVTSVAPNLATCLKGRNNKVTVGFANNTFAYNQEGEGIITLPVGEGEKWVILLPQNEVVDNEANSSDGIWTGTCGCVPAIAENDYLTEGITVEITHPIGSVNSLFTINANGNQVWFSHGNLQYIGSAATPYWKFADNQFDYFGTSTGQYSTSQTVNRDIFGWGTSGYSHGANCYQPWSTSTSYNNYYAYGAYTNNLYDGNGQADWGYNAIRNGGNTGNSGWRTLTQPEWDYVFNTRSTASGIRWAQGTVDGKNGTILLPDNWTADIYALNDTNGGNYESNTISAEGWTNTLEANGAVFLPGAGRRQGTSPYGTGSYGGYWSASYYNNKVAYYVYFDDGVLVPTGHDRTRDYGLSVRLVHDPQ